MPLNTLIEQIRNHPDSISFDAVMQVIDSHYDYRPARFSNGIGEHRLINDAGQNPGSCKIFAFARLHGLTEEQTLACFGDFYRVDVLQHPGGSDHANIRNFMRHGWAGIHFDQPPLSPRD